MFWVPYSPGIDYNSGQPWNDKDNLKLCYYSFDSSDSCSSTSTTCFQGSKNIFYSIHSDQTCRNDICNITCKSAVACNGVMHPQSTCSKDSTIINYDDGLCSNNACTWDSGVYRCGCTCNLNQNKNYNTIYQGDTKKCWVFHTNGS